MSEDEFKNLNKRSIDFTVDLEMGKEIENEVPFTEEYWAPKTMFDNDEKFFIESNEDGEPVLKMRLTKADLEEQIKFWTQSK